MLWEDDQFINDNTLTANITRLRQKLSSLNLANGIVTKKRARIYGHYTIGGSKLFISYVNYKKSWIGLIVILLLLTNALILFDAGIHVEPYSIIYLNGLFLTICVVFFVWRYKKKKPLIINPYLRFLTIWTMTGLKASLLLIAIFLTVFCIHFSKPLMSKIKTNVVRITSYNKGIIMILPHGFMK